VEDDRVSPEIAAELVTDPIPGERLCVLVAKQEVLYEHVRMIELTRNWMGGQFEVVESMDEAYRMLGVRSEDFSERLFPKKLAWISMTRIHLRSDGLLCRARVGL
jgi:hypothetical protein